MDKPTFDPYQALINCQRMDVEISQNMSELSLLVVDIAKTQDQLKREIANIRRDIAYLYSINTKAQK